MERLLSAGRLAWTLGLLLAVGSTSGCVVRRDPAAVRWLAHDCTVGERGKLAAELRAAGEPAERTLIEAHKEGPPKAVIDELATEAGLQYDEVIEAFDAGRTYDLDQDEIAEFRAITRQEFIRDEVDAFKAAFKSLAISGLIVVSRQTGLDYVRRVGHTAASP
jgi:hypothetical protein